VIKHLLTVGALAAVALGWAVTTLLGAGELPGVGGSYRVNVIVPSAAGLGVGANVTVAGLPVGRVQKMERAGSGARLELRLEDEQAPVATDTRFGVRLRTVVGENYVELFPGRGAAMVPSGGTLPMAQADAYVDVDSILDVVKGETRDRARAFLRGLGEGVDGHGRQLNDVFRGAGGVVEDAAPITTLLAGDRREIARLVDEVGQIAGEVDASGASLVSLADGLRTTFSTVRRRDEDVRATLTELPSALRQIRSTTTVLRAVSRRAAPVVQDTGVAVRRLGPAITNLRPAAQEGRELLRAIDGSAPELVRTLAGVRRVATPAAQALPELRKGFCQVAPAAKYLRPYWREITSVLQALGSSTNFYDANSHAARLFASVGEDSIRALDPQTAKLVQQLLETGLLGEIGAKGYNPFPAPGDAGETAKSGAPLGPKDVKAPYPRIRAEC